MPVLKTLLSDFDLDFLSRIARVWRIEISQRDVNSAEADLCAGMLEPGNLDEVITRLPKDSQKAWKTLLSRGGHMPWAAFSREYGDIRAIGPARRERENPDQSPISISENLWYSGLVGKAFLKFSEVPEEYIYIPEEFMPSGLQGNKPEGSITIHPAVDQKPRKTQRADSSILDYLIDMLASARMEREIPPSLFQSWNVSQGFLKSLLESANLLSKSGQPDSEMLKVFFQKSRGQNLFSLFRAWMNSPQVNDLRMLPGLAFEGSWQNDPILPRRLLVGILAELKAGPWWSISTLISMIKDQTPDFQRPAGDYDSWFIRDRQTNTYLRGFEHWDEVEGKLLYYLLTGPLHWLGVLNLAYGEEIDNATSFQLTLPGRALLKGIEPTGVIKEQGDILIKGITSITIPCSCPRILRYQVARFCEFQSATPTESHYSLTPNSLKKAAEQGLGIHQLIQLLEKEQSKTIPPAFKILAERWQSKGLEVEFKPATLLRFSDASTCLQVQTDPNTARFCIEVLNPKTLLIPREQVEGMRKLLAEIGILAQVDPDV